MDLYENDTADNIRPPALSKYAQSLLEGTNIVDNTVVSVTKSQPTTTRSTIRSRHRTPLNLGAPRRLSNGIEVETEDDRRTATKTAYSTKVFSNSRRSSFTEDAVLDPPTHSIPRQKRSMVRTPNYKSTGLSPIVKRTDQHLSSSPETPEIGRRALAPLSAEKVNQVSCIWDEPEVDLFKSPEVRGADNKKAEAPRQSPIRRDSQKFKRLLEEELLKQKNQILHEVLSHKKESQHIEIKGDRFEVVELVGKGGSSKVYRVRKKGATTSLAVKVVTFDEHDQTTINEFKGEISILEKLHDHDRVVQLIDYVLKPSSLLFVMECGEIDLAHVLSERQGRPFEASFVRYHALEILKCVSQVHNAGVVHADLKPANFLFVRGTLKLIDFGISNALTDQTANVYRECQMGTPNYMAPETLVEVDSKGSMWKVGKPADVWSCGCIIYQMCYGRPPYASYPGNKKILAITNSKLQITYPRVAPGGGEEVSGMAIDLMKQALQRDPAERWTAEKLMRHQFLVPNNVSERFVSDLVRSAVKFGQQHPEVKENRINQLAESVWRRIE